MNNNGQITAPVNTDDVSAVIGVPSHDVGTLCTSPKVNKWSKHKPVRGESPADYTTWNRQTGNVRADVGYPIYFGMILPFNNKQQLNISTSSVGHRYLKPLAWRASHRANANSEGNVKNYVYCPPMVGSDFFRLGDFVGYRHYSREAWTTGVTGAVDKASTSNYAGSTGLDLAVDTFDTNEVHFYFGCPYGYDITMAELYDMEDYRFFVELYLADQGVSSDSDVPEAVLVSTKTIAQLGVNGASFIILVNKLASIVGITSYGTGIQKIVAVLGVNRLGSITLTEEKTSDNKGLGYAILTTTAQKNVIMEGQGSIAPWSTDHKPFICDIEFRSFSKITIAPQQCAIPPSGSWQNMPTSQIAWHSDGIMLKCIVSNKGTSAVNLRTKKFSIQARGTFDLNDPSVAAMCINGYEGKWSNDLNHTVTFSTSSSFSDTSSAITIAAGGSATVYFRCLGFIPKGAVNACTMKVANSTDDLWVITASFSVWFLVS